MGGENLWFPPPLYLKGFFKKGLNWESPRVVQITVIPGSLEIPARKASPVGEEFPRLTKLGRNFPVYQVGRIFRLPGSGLGWYKIPTPGRLNPGLGVLPLYYGRCSQLIPPHPNPLLKLEFEPVWKTKVWEKML